jgi:Helix-turn-helix.
VRKKRHITFSKAQITFESVTISSVRKKKGYTQAQMAKILHLDRSALSHYERGKRSIPEDVLKAYKELPKRGCRI